MFWIPERLNKSLDNYLSLSEIALSCFNTVNSIKRHQFTDNLVISRRRVNLKDNSFYNLLNIVINHKTRNVDNYLQYILLENTYKYEEIADFLKNWILIITNML